MTALVFALPSPSPSLPFPPFLFPPPPFIKDIALWISTDAGRTFSPLKCIRVSESTSSYDADGPWIAADPDNNTVWVWWWADNKHWLRKFDIAEDGTPTTTMAPLSLSDLNFPGVSPPIPAFPIQSILHASLAIQPRGKGCPPRLFLTYDDTGHSYQRYLKCDTYSPQLRINWYMSYSDDNGLTWTTRHITEDASWPRCISPGNFGQNRPYPSTAYDPVSRRLLITLNKSAYRQNGTYAGTRAMLFQWPGSDGREFDSWTPLCNPSASKTLLPPELASNPLYKPIFDLFSNLLPLDETFCDQYGPSVSTIDVSDEQKRSSRAGWIWYDTRDSTIPPLKFNILGKPEPATMETDIWGAVITPGSPFDSRPLPQRRITPLYSGGTPLSKLRGKFGVVRKYGRVPWDPSASRFGNTWWGDYSNGVTGLDRDFFGMWADMRDYNTFSRLYGASFVS